MLFENIFRQCICDLDILRLSLEMWSYGSINGPEEWPKFCPEAAGERQSPVDIEPEKLKILCFSRKLRWEYSPNETNLLTNTGHSWQVSAAGTQSELVGGPLEHRFVLKQVHCHWGETDDEGSEHTINGKPYAGELHLVHWNKSKYKTFEEAIQYPDGVGVVAVFLKVGEPNQELDKVIKCLPDVQYKGDSIEMDPPLDPVLLMPEDGSYWTYKGSLTTPPCTECVTWIIFKTPLEVSSEQLDVMRTLRTHTKEEELDDDTAVLKKNYRPVRPLGQREIKEGL